MNAMYSNRPVELDKNCQIQYEQSFFFFFFFFFFPGIDFIKYLSSLSKTDWCPSGRVEHFL